MGRMFEVRREFAWPGRHATPVHGSTASGNISEWAYNKVMSMGFIWNVTLVYEEMNIFQINADEDMN